MRKNYASKYKQNSGFGMIEILIAMVIIAIGLLGLAGLQLLGLRSNNFSYNRTQAIVLAYEMTDKIRANSVGMTNGDYNQATATAHATCLVATGCTTTEMAEHDVDEWNDAIQANLPSGAGIICVDSTPTSADTVAAPACDGLGSQYTVKIWWDDDRDGTQDAPFIVSFQP